MSEWTSQLIKNKLTYQSFSHPTPPKPRHVPPPLWRLPRPAMTPAQEPTVTTPPVRRFKDPAYTAVAPTLADLRERIDTLDEQIVALLAQRALCVRDATRFKRDAFQVAAPARQAQVFERVRTLAAQHENVFPGLPDIVESTYRTLVAGFIAGEGTFFHDTELITP